MNFPNFCPFIPKCIEIEYFLLHFFAWYIPTSIEHVHTWYMFKLTLGALVLQKKSLIDPKSAHDMQSSFINSS